MRLPKTAQKAIFYLLLASFAISTARADDVKYREAAAEAEINAGADALAPAAAKAESIRHEIEAFGGGL